MQTQKLEINTGKNYVANVCLFTPFVFKIAQTTFWHKVLSLKILNRLKIYT